MKKTIFKIFPIRYILMVFLLQVIKIEVNIGKKFLYLEI